MSPNKTMPRQAVVVWLGPVLMLTLAVVAKCDKINNLHAALTVLEADMGKNLNSVELLLRMKHNQNYENSEMGKFGTIFERAKLMYNDCKAIRVYALKQEAANNKKIDENLLKHTEEDSLSPDGVCTMSIGVFMSMCKISEFGVETCCEILLQNPSQVWQNLVGAKHCPGADRFIYTQPPAIRQIYRSKLLSELEGLHGKSLDKANKLLEFKSTHVSISQKELGLLVTAQDFCHSEVRAQLKTEIERCEMMNMPHNYSPFSGLITEKCKEKLKTAMRNANLTSYTCRSFVQSTTWMHQATASICA